MKKVIITTIQVLIAIGLFWFILREEETRESIARYAQTANYALLLLAFALLLLVFAGTGLRWWLLVRVQGIHFKKSRAILLTYISQFFSSLLPGATGGDVLRIFYVTKETKDKKSAAFLSVLMDRLVGMLALFSIAAIFFAFRFKWYLAGDGDEREVIIFFACFVSGVLFGIGVSLVITLKGWEHSLPQWLPLRSKFVELAAAYRLYAKSWKATLGAFGISLVLHGMQFEIFHLASMAIGAGVPRSTTYSLIPAINTLVAIPLTPGGAAYRETIFQTMFAPIAGISVAAATWIGIVGTILYSAVGVIGAFIHYFYRSSQDESKTSLEDMSHQVEELEEDVEEEDERAVEEMKEQAQHEREQKEAASSQSPPDTGGKR